MALKVWGIGDRWAGRRVIAATTQLGAASVLNLKGGAKTLRTYGGLTTDPVEVEAAMREPGRVFATKGERWGRRGQTDPFQPEGQDA